MTDSLIGSGGSLNSIAQTMWNKIAQDRLVKNFTFYKFLDKVPYPKNSGFTFQFRRYDNVAGSTSALAENTLTAGQVQLSAQIKTGALAQYGQFITLTDFAQLTGPDNEIQAAVDVLTDAASDTVDLLCRDALSSGTAYLPNGKTSANLGASDTLRAADVRKIVRNFTANNVRTFEDRTYVAILSPYQTHDLMADTDVGGWLQTNQYTNYKQIHAGEMGMLYGVRIIHSNNVAATATAEVGSTVGTSGKTGYFIGAHAASAIDLESNPINILIKKPGSGGTSDPYSNIATVAYKLKGFGAVWNGADGPRVYRALTPVSA